nr:C842 [uncultured bacterium]
MRHGTPADRCNSVASVDPHKTSFVIVKRTLLAIEIQGGQFGTK